MAYEVFISYSSKDFTTASAACAAIEATGAHCWMAPRNIRPGKAYGEAIIEGMNECKIFVLVYSPHSNASPQVLREVERAVSKGLEVITLRLAEFPMSKAMEYFLAASHWLNAVNVDLNVYLKTLSDSVHLGLEQPDAMCQFDVPNTPANNQVPAPIVPKHNLPAPISSFIGRDIEKHEVSELLSANRLVTLTGSGGSGKSRLALEAASNLLEHFTDGAIWIDLSPVNDADSCLQLILKSLSISEDPNTPAKDTIVHHIKDKKLLLITDNCEHLIDICSDLVSSLLESCSGLKTLATSRSPLSIPGEIVYTVKPLTVPTPRELPHSGDALVESISHFDSVRLFIERARDVSSTFTLTEGNATAIAQICARLDGVPLAIELAAARIKALSPDQILTRLEDQFRLLGGNKGAPVRQQTLRATMDWSYNLLDKNEQILLNRLSVFRGSFTLDGVEAICAVDPISDWDIIDLITQLVDKSLILVEEWDGTYRYHQLQSIRDYAAEKWALMESDIDIVSANHTQYYKQILIDIEPKLWSEYQDIWLEKMEEHKPNWLQAITWTLERKQFDSSLDIASPASRYWMLRGYINEGRLWLEKVRGSASTDSVTSSPAYAKVVNACGSMAWSQNDLDTAKARFEESLSLYKSLNDTQHIADLQNNLGNLTLDNGNDAEAKGLLEEALASFKAMGDKQGMSASLGNLALIALRSNQLNQAKLYYQESLAIDRDLGDTWAVAMSLHGLGVIECREHDLEQSTAHLIESLKLRAGINDQPGLAESIEGLAELSIAKSRYERAVSLLAAATVIREQCGAVLPVFEQERIDSLISNISLKIDKSTYERCRLAGKSWSQATAINNAYDTD